MWWLFYCWLEPVVRVMRVVHGVAQLLRESIQRKQTRMITIYSPDAFTGTTRII
jgi:hypothetical protein